MIPAYSLSEIARLKPCRERLAFARSLNLKGKVTAKQAVEAGITFDDLLWVTAALARTDREVKSRLQAWLADVAAHVLHIYERRHPADMRVRDCIISCQQYARGEIDAAARDAARAAARDAAWHAARDAARDAAWHAARDAARAAARAAAWDAAGDAAGDAARAAAWDAAWHAARAAAWDAAGDAAGDAARAAAWDAAWHAARAAAWAAAGDAERQWQLDRLVYWLSEEKPKFWPLPEKRMEKAA